MPTYVQKLLIDATSLSDVAATSTVDGQLGSLDVFDTLASGFSIASNRILQSKADVLRCADADVSLYGQVECTFCPNDSLPGDPFQNMTARANLYSQNASYIYCEIYTPIPGFWQLSVAGQGTEIGLTGEFPTNTANFDARSDPTVFDPTHTFKITMKCEGVFPTNITVKIFDLTADPTGTTAIGTINTTCMANSLQQKGHWGLGLLFRGATANKYMSFKYLSADASITAPYGSLDPIYCGVIGDSNAYFNVGDSGGANTGYDTMPGYLAAEFFRRTGRRLLLTNNSSFGQPVEGFSPGTALLNSFKRVFGFRPITVTLCLLSTNNSWNNVRTLDTTVSTDYQAIITDLVTNFNQKFFILEPGFIDYTNPGQPGVFDNQSDTFIQSYIVKLKAIAAADPTHVGYGFGTHAYTEADPTGTLRDGVHFKQAAGIFVGQSNAQPLKDFLWPTPLLLDTFTGTALSVLDGHVADTGQTWHKSSVPSSTGTGDIFLHGDNSIYGTSANELHLIDPGFTSPEYDVEFDATWINNSGLNGGDISGQILLLYRLNVETFLSSQRYSYYHIQLNPATGPHAEGQYRAADLNRTRPNDGSDQLAAGDLTNGFNGLSFGSWANNISYHFKLTVRDAVKNFYKDGVLVYTSVQDNNVTGAGVLAISTNNYSVDYGVFIKNFKVYAASGTLTAPTASVIDVGPTGMAVKMASSLMSGTPASGTPPYTYQWHLSTSSGFTPSGGTAQSEKTSVAEVFTGLTPSTTYYAKCVITDTTASTVTTNEVSGTTAAAYAAGSLVIGLIGDSISGGFLLSMVPTLASGTGRTIVRAARDIGGTNTSTWCAENQNFTLRDSILVFKAKGCNPWVANMLVTNDASIALDRSQTGRNFAGTSAAIVSAGFKVINNYPVYRFDHVDWDTTFLIPYMAEIKSVEDNVNIFTGDKGASYKYTSLHPELYGDGLHPNTDPIGPYRTNSWLPLIMTPGFATSLSASTGQVGDTVTVTFTLAGGATFVKGTETVDDQTLTPTDNGGGGSFGTTTFAADSNTGTVVYTIGSAGTKSIGATTNSGWISGNSTLTASGSSDTGLRISFRRRKLRRKGTSMKLKNQAIGTSPQIFVKDIGDGDTVGYSVDNQSGSAGTIAVTCIGYIGGNPTTLSGPDTVAANASIGKAIDSRGYDKIGLSISAASTATVDIDIKAT